MWENETNSTFELDPAGFEQYELRFNCLVFFSMLFPWSGWIKEGVKLIGQARKTDKVL